MSDEPMRMDAYYYGFYPTGCQKVDIILSAVACAGKAYHHTEDWGEQTTPRPHLTGESPVDWIQNAASAAAAEMQRLRTALSKIADRLDCRPDYGVSGRTDHYCPNCDRSTADIREVALAALKSSEDGELAVST